MSDFIIIKNVLPLDPTPLSLRLLNNYLLREQRVNEVTARGEKVKINSGQLQTLLYCADLFTRKESLETHFLSQAYCS